MMVGTAFVLDWSSMITLWWLCMFMFTFSLGLGPVTFVVASEVGGKPHCFLFCRGLIHSNPNQLALPLAASKNVPLFFSN